MDSRPSPDPSLRFSWAEQEDLVEVETFIDDQFGPGSVQAIPGRAKWLFFENPAGLHMALCRASEKLVAMCGHLPQEIATSGGNTVAGFGVDFMVAGPWRRMGIGRQFLEMRLQRFPLSLSTGQSPKMKKLYVRSGATDWGRLQHATFRQTPGISKDLRRSLRNVVIYTRGVATKGNPGPFECLPMDLDSAADSPSVTDRRWFRWRYGSPVYDDYQFLDVRHDGSSIGTCVVRRAERWTSIIDLHCPRDFRVRVLTAVARTESRPEIRLPFFGRELGKDCRRAGFVVGNRNAHMMALMRQEGTGIQPTGNSLNLFSGASDADLLRRPVGNRDRGAEG